MIQITFVIHFVTLLLVNFAQAREYYRLPLPLKAIGPEAIAFDCEGKGPYVGVSDGRILKWQGAEHGWTEFAVTSPHRSDLCNGVDNSPMEEYCGRPLGLRFNKATCELYIADSSFGLLKVHKSGGVAISLATSIEGIPFKFLNALDIDAEAGVVYFTDTSTQYPRWEYTVALATYDQTGRFMKYDIKTGVVTILLKGLVFPNGVALSKDKDFVLITETTAKQITRYWLTGPKAETSEVFVHLRGIPDNINRNSNGEFWVAQNPTKPIRLDQDGKLLESLDPFEIVDASDVTEFGRNLWIGSVNEPYIIYTT